MSKKNKTNLRRRNVNPKKDLLQERINKINEAIVKKNISELRELATTGPGLVDEGLRRRCWPLLLHCEHYKPYDKKDLREKHKDERQVLLDVDRSFVHYPKDLTIAEKKRKQSELNDVIVGILRRHPKLAYYQGFHDVCSVLLLVLKSKENAIKAGENIAMFLLRDAMRDDSLDLISRQVTFLNTLIRLEDPEIADFLEKSTTLPYFCLSWVMTWCSHDIRDLSKVVRLFDFFIASDPLITVYLSARVVINRRKELLALECDYATVHHFLSEFPQYVDINDLISKTIQLYKKHKPFLQKAIGEALDETSCVILHKEHWLRLKVGEPIDYSDVNEILYFNSLDKKPVQIENSKKLNKQLIAITIVVLVLAITVPIIKWLFDRYF